MKRAALLLLAAAGVSCSAASGGKATAPQAGASPRSPYEAPPAAAHAIEVHIDAEAAREILGSLSRPKFDPADAKVLEGLPAVRLTIQDSTRGPEVFERDMEAAFDEKTRSAVFDLWKIRQERDRWQALLTAVMAREKDLSRLAARRAAALLPGDRAISTRVRVYLTFGIAGLADHLVVESQGQDIMVVDLARALGDSQGEALESQISRLSRLIAGEAFRQSWLLYRRGSPAWEKGRAETAPIEQLLVIVAEAAPVALFSVDENFFPLAVWLKAPMKRAIDDLNRHAERFAQAQDNLEARMGLTGELRRPSFARQVAGPAGAFLADAVLQDAGMDAFRAGLQKGPKGLFAAYDRVAQSDKSLIPLSHTIRERIK